MTCIVDNPYTGVGAVCYGLPMCGQKVWTYELCFHPGTAGESFDSCRSGLETAQKAIRFAYITPVFGSLRECQRDTLDFKTMALRN